MRSIVLRLMVLLALLSGGCQAGRFDEPMAVMLDRDRAVYHRVAAAEQLGAIEEADEPQRYRRALSHLAWSDREPIELRRIAIDRLIAHDAAAFMREADRRITDVELWPALQHIFDHAAAHGWREFIPIAIRSYARPTRDYDDHHRPEHELIAALEPGQPVERTVYDVFLGSHEVPHTLAHQAAAWHVLHRMHDPATLRVRLDEAVAATASLVRDLRAAAEVLDEWPAHREQLAWLMRLREMEEGELWRTMCDGAAALSDAQREGLALRHLPLLVMADDEALVLDRATLQSRIADRLHGRRHVTRTTGVPRDTWTESFDDQRERLPWGDLLAIDIVQRALADPDIKRALFEQAEADRLDESSEHGGAFVVADHGEDGGWHPKAFAPGLRVHAYRYVASEALIEQMHTSLAHYHFHAQRYANAEYAGPGAGDLAFAERFGCHALVLTFIDRDTLNVDYYQPDGVVVDLGNVVRR